MPSAVADVAPVVAALPPVAIVTVIVGCLLQALFIRADLRHAYVSAAVLKALASAAFVLLGVVGLAACTQGDSQSGASVAPAALVCLGLFLGAAGDVLHALRFVLTHRRHLFGQGAVMFFLGHVAYLAVLVPRCSQPAAGLSVGLTGTAVLLGWMARRLSVTGYRRCAYGAYLLTVCLMAGFAVVDAVAMPSPPALSFAVGALLFLLSDSLLALNAFGAAASPAEAAGDIPFPEAAGDIPFPEAAGATSSVKAACVAGDPTGTSRPSGTGRTRGRKALRRAASLSVYYAAQLLIALAVLPA
ncbi:MAG: hypothetical protein KH372_01340 [Olsenella uli]|uniref:lysoplasmalogenase family protein n=1 Tax=Olsenella uli TaxID=133926 RepID=UPI001DB637CA|nr:lysoplasmalogenase family protein [Olsenella uli]MBS6417459.1 hypothetical protein [Olsenella uli]